MPNYVYKKKETVMHTNGRPEITCENLNEKEKAALIKLVREAYSLYLAADTDITFDVWLTMLQEGIHEALLSQLKKRNSH